HRLPGGDAAPARSHPRRAHLQGPPLLRPRPPHHGLRPLAVWGQSGVWGQSRVSTLTPDSSKRGESGACPSLTPTPNPTLTTHPTLTPKGAKGGRGVGVTR